MKLSVYNQVRELMSTCKSRRNVKKLAADNGFGNIPTETMISIYSQDLQKKMKKAFPIHNKEDRKLGYRRLFFRRVKDCEEHVILRMAEELDLSPCMLIRFILDVHMLDVEPEKYTKPKVRARAITELLRKPYSMKNKVLACAIQQAVVVDDIFGPFADRIRRCVGLEFEGRLIKWCKEQKIDFLSEDDMRKQGYDKTPDVKLLVPVAVDGFVINWIESKAMFGDMDGHTKHVKEQIAPYLRRFGPGLVIYWFGFVDALDCQRKNGVALAEGLPKKVQRFDVNEWLKHPEWDIPKLAFKQPEIKRY